jgi:hypothetical protein
MYPRIHPLSKAPTTWAPMKIVDVSGKPFNTTLRRITRSRIALAQQGIEHNSLGAILLTHLHATTAAACRSS